MYIQVATPRRRWFQNPAIFFIEGVYAKEITYGKLLQLALKIIDYLQCTRKNYSIMTG